MYNKLAKLFPNGIEGNVLSISELGDLSFIVNGNVTEVFYPEYDMQNLNFSDGSFDCVISDQVLEHVEDAQKAVNESLRVLKKGGIAIHTSCFMNYYHPSPKDYWRFSEDAFRFLCKDFSEILQTGSWGNRLVIMLYFIGDRFRSLEVGKLLRPLATFNEKQYPITTWIVAKK